MYGKEQPLNNLPNILYSQDTGGINMTDEEVKMFADAVQEATSDGEFLAEDPARIEITVSALESVVGEGVSSVEVRTRHPVCLLFKRKVCVNFDVRL